MNLPRAPRGSYKAFLLDYDSLLNYTDEECSYCLSEREIQMLLGIIDPIAWATRYKPTHTDIDKNLIETWRDNLARKLMSGCCPDPITNRRYGEDGILEVSYDGGITWVDAPQLDDRISGTISPPITGEDGDDKKCAAAASAEEYVKQNWIEVLETGDGYGQIFAAAIAAVAALGVTGVGILIAAAIAAILLAGVAVVQAAFTTEVWAQFRCILYCHILPDGSFGIDEWQLVKIDIGTDFDGVVAIVLYNWINTVGPVGLTNAARSGFVASADCDSCECGPPCEDKYDIWVDGIPVGTILERGDGFIVAQAHSSGYLTLAAVIPADCCFVGSFDIISGSAFGSGFQACGGTQIPPWTGATPVGQTPTIMEFQGSGSFIIKIYLGAP